MPEARAGQPVILVTGFASAEGEGANPSQELLPLLASDPPGGVSLRTQLLPADWETALLKAIETMDRLFPDAVISLGPGDGPSELSVERVAVNVDERGGPGAVRRSEPIDAAGPAAYFSTLPVHDMVETMMRQGIPATVSSSAGTRLCNRLFYALMHYVSLRGHETWFKKSPPAGLVSRIGLIRLPACSAAPHPRAKGAEIETGARAGAPPRRHDGVQEGLPLETSLRGVRLGIEVVAEFLALPEITPASS